MSNLINREDAINELYNINPSEDFLFIDAIVDMLENLPSIETKPQKAMMDDLIKRKDVIKAMKTLEDEDNKTYGCSIPECFDSNRAIEALNKLPSAEQEEFEWCHNCKEYDQEQHCCHRWTKVIRQTVEELKAQKPETTAKVKEAWGLAMCESCKKRVYENDIYCSHCGAKLDWSENE